MTYHRNLTGSENVHTHINTHFVVENLRYNIALWLRTRTPELDWLNSDPLFST